MYLIQLFLPIYGNRGEKFSALHYREVRDELVEKFGGVTAYTHSPAHGLWQPDEERTVQDDLVTYEVMAQDLERPWWRACKARLEHRFQQQEILIRAQVIEVLQ